MCFNAQVSIITYIIGLIGSYQLYKYKFVPEAVFYAWVIQMQLIEYFLWKNQPCSGSNIEPNKNISKIGIIVNHFEPIILWLAIIYYSKKKLPNWVHILMIVFCITSYYYTKQVIADNECTTVTKESEPHLYWKWNNQGPHYILYYTYFLIALIVLSLYGLQNGHINALLVITSYIFSMMIYRKTHTVGAMWCFAAAFGPFILLYLHGKLNFTYT
jgi:hypothetical protein